MARWMFLMFGIVMMLPVLVGVAIGFGLGSSDGSWLAVAARIVAIAFGMLALLAVVSFGFFRRWRPVRHLIDAAGQLADGDYAVRVPVARSGSQLTLWRARSGLLYYRKNHGWMTAWAVNRLERSWHALRGWRAALRGQADKAAESATHLALLQRAWRDTLGGRVAPPRPW